MRIVRALAALAAVAASGAAAASTAPGWPRPVYGFDTNPPSPAVFELGRRLFYDPVLSRDGSTSCASCHQQAAAFAHPGHRLSHGVGGQLGTRNAPGLFNLAWQPSFMWDGAIAHLELQPLAPIANPMEMDLPPAALAPKLLATPGYPQTFERAFGSPGIDTARILKALAQFTGGLVSNDAHYDRVRAGREAFTAVEARGLAVFRAHCGSCHAEPLFTDFSFRGNGLDAAGADAGRAKASGAEVDRGRFRVPSLRNVAVTAPYMHDGRLPTLEAVLDHYDHGVVASAALDPSLADGIRLAPEERAALIAFLQSLSDSTLLTDARFSDPSQARSPDEVRVSAERESCAPAGAPGLRPGYDHCESPPGWLSRFFSISASAQENPAVTTASRIDPGFRLALADDRVELVIAREDRVLRIYADDFATNTPLSDLAVSVASGTVVLQAAAVDGAYTVPADRLDPTRPNPLRITVRGDDWSRTFSGELPPAPPDAATVSRRPWGAATTFLALAGLLLAFLTAIRHVRQRA